MGLAQVSKFVKPVLLSALGAFLGGCLANTPVQSTTAKAPPPQQAVTPIPTAEPKKPVDPMVAARASVEQKVLAQAEAAFRKGNLTTPPHNNAYDRFHSVLMLNPNNQQARSGLQAIVILYADMIRDSLAASRYTQANALLKQAQIYYPAHPLLLELQKEARKSQLHSEQVMLKQSPSDLTIQEFPLPERKLSRNKEELIPFLASIAQRVKVTEESIMIYARTDAEGRWIYKQMKKAAEGYRIRGDIRLAKSPKIAILPPL
ncbi:hypothetical protein P886_4446 [Alteromonadaceae bacterium 2753L.S.0a.02]|nr:hypothetical protein P886_4446 [Alteromonadaceae bacterium 2753L.S.0a.02]